MIFIFLAIHLAMFIHLATHMKLASKESEWYEIVNYMPNQDIAGYALKRGE